jgi:hypothetical protein
MASFSMRFALRRSVASEVCPGGEYLHSQTFPALKKWVDCTAYACLMNGSNHQEEKDRRPMHLCPVCLRKLCWNLWVEPVPYLTKMKAFCQQNCLDPESRLRPESSSRSPEMGQQRKCDHSDSEKSHDRPGYTQEHLTHSSEGDALFLAVRQRVI